MTYEITTDEKTRFQLVSSETNVKFGMFILGGEQKWRSAVLTKYSISSRSEWTTTARDIEDYPEKVRELNFDNTMCVVESCAGLGGLMQYLTGLKESRPKRLVAIDFVNYKTLRDLIEKAKEYRTAPDEQIFLDKMLQRCELLLGPEIELHNVSIKQALQDESLFEIADVLVENRGPASSQYQLMNHTVYNYFMKLRGIQIIS